MKKLISFAVAGMFALSLAACGSSSSAAASITESSAESTAANAAAAVIERHEKIAARLRGRRG